MTHLIFEETTSALYYSNDGRLRLLGSTTSAFVLQLDGTEVFATYDRVKADAYIAGYDLARDNEIDPLAQAAKDLGIEL